MQALSLFAHTHHGAGGATGERQSIKSGRTSTGDIIQARLEQHLRRDPAGQARGCCWRFCHGLCLWVEGCMCV